MKHNVWGLMVLIWISTAGLAAAADRWMHVKVIENGADGDRVRVNIPLSLAEKVLPTIRADKLHDGKIQIEGYKTDKVDLRALLDAVRDAPDNEYVTVDSGHESVRVAKSGGYLLVKVQENHGDANKPPQKGEKKRDSKADIKVPFAVVNALLSGEKEELNLLAAIREMGKYPDIDLVTVNDDNSTVRIWVDSKSAAD